MRLPEYTWRCAIDTIWNLIQSCQNAETGHYADYSWVIRENVANILSKDKEEDHDRNIEASTTRQT